METRLFTLLFCLLLPVAACQEQEPTAPVAQYATVTGTRAPENATITHWKDGRKLAQDNTSGATHTEKIEIPAGETNIRTDSSTATAPGHNSATLPARYYYANKTYTQDIDLLPTGMYQAILILTKSTPGMQVILTENGTDIDTLHTSNSGGASSKSLRTDGILDKLTASKGGYTNQTLTDIPLQNHYTTTITLEKPDGEPYLIKGTVYGPWFENTVDQGTLTFTTDDDKQHVAQIQPDGTFNLTLQDPNYNDETHTTITLTGHPQHVNNTFSILAKNAALSSNKTAAVNIDTRQRTTATTTLDKLATFTGVDITWLPDSITQNNDIMESLGNLRTWYGTRYFGIDEWTPSNITFYVITPFLDYNKQDEVDEKLLGYMQEATQHVKAYLDPEQGRKTISFKPNIVSKGLPETPGHTILYFMDSHPNANSVVDRRYTSGGASTFNEVFMATADSSSYKEFFKYTMSGLGITPNRDNDIDWAYEEVEIDGKPTVQLTPEGKSALYTFWAYPAGSFRQAE
jgi:hypothetical protein